MLGRIRDFLYRHRRKFLITGGIVGGLVLISKYAEYKLFEWHDKQTSALIEKKKRRQHYEKTRQTANATVLSLSNSITQIVCDQLPTDALLHALRDKPADKLQLWEELKIVGFSRCISTIYTSALVGSLVHAKLMLVGGYSFGETTKVGSVEIKISPECQEKYLCHLQNFVEKGIPSLTAKIQLATKHSLRTLGLDQQITLERLEGIIKDIILLLNGEGASYSASSDVEGFQLYPWSRYIVDSALPRNEDLAFQKMTEGLMDVVDGEDFYLVVQNLVQHGLNHVIDYVADFYPSSPAANLSKPAFPSVIINEVGLETKELSSSLNEVNCTVGEGTLQSGSSCILSKSTLPVAKLVPILSDLVHPCLSPAPGHLLQFILLSEQLENMSFNIYEAFSVAN